jgi:hypothetical protein
LQAIGETDSEKYQVIDSFGKPQLFMFGRRYRIYSYSGMLWNNKCNNWKDEFKYIYNKYLRGTECVNYGVKIMLTYDRSVRLGYLLSMTINQVADVEMAVPVSFSMFIEEEKELVDEGLIDPGNTNTSQDVFNLLRLQSASVDSAKSTREKAISQKLQIIPNSDTPPSAPEKGSVANERLKAAIERRKARQNKKIAATEIAAAPQLKVIKTIKDGLNSDNPAVRDSAKYEFIMRKAMGDISGGATTEEQAWAVQYKKNRDQ